MVEVSRKALESSCIKPHKPAAAAAALGQLYPPPSPSPRTRHPMVPHSCQQLQRQTLWRRRLSMREHAQCRSMDRNDVGAQDPANGAIILHDDDHAHGNSKNDDNGGGAADDDDDGHSIDDSRFGSS